MDISLFTYHVNRHLGCFYFWAIVNNVAVNIHVQVFEWMFSFFLDLYLGVELLGHMVT